jgi:hypothetical protein
VLEAFRWRQFVLSIPNAAAFEIPGLSKTDFARSKKFVLTV